MTSTPLDQLRVDGVAEPAPDTLGAGSRSVLGRVGQWLALAPAILLFGGCFGFALVLIALYSVWDVRDFEVVTDWNTGNYTYLFSVPTYARTMLATAWVSAVATLITLGLAFPFAYWLTRYVPARWRTPLLIAAVLPFFASYLLRIYAWLSILGANGALNELLRWTGVADEPVSFFLFDRPAVIVVLVYLYFPFAALTLYVGLEQFDWRQLRAAIDLGASPLTALRRILLPQIRPALITAVIFTFVPMVGEYVTPLIVGGTKGVMAGNLIANFFDGGEYARGAAAALVVAVPIFAILVLFRRSLELGGSDERRR